MIALMGDIHFRDDKEYFKIVCEEFLNWYRCWEINNPNNTLVLLGDVVDKPTLSGNVTDYLERFAKYSKFKEVHICVGNHDVGKIRNENQLAYRFYAQKDGFIIHDEPSESVIEGKRVLFMPHFMGVDRDGLSMREFYSSLWENPRFSKHYDFAVGHFYEQSITFGMGDEYIPNIDKIDCDRVVLGHIHRRNISPEIYIGSVFANNIAENDDERCVMLYDEGVWREDRLPIFNRFETVTYPGPLPKSKGLIPIYRILNCSSEAVAREKYKNINIHSVTADPTEGVMMRQRSAESQMNDINEFRITNMFKDFSKNRKTPVDDSVFSMCYDMVDNREKNEMNVS